MSHLVSVYLGFYGFARPLSCDHQILVPPVQINTTFTSRRAISSALQLLNGTLGVNARSADAVASCRTQQSRGGGSAV